MKKWLGYAVMLLCDNVSFGQPGIEDYQKAQEAAQANNLAGAIEPCEAALQASPDYLNCYLWLGYAYGQQKQPAKQADNLAEFVKKTEGNAEAAALRTQTMKAAGIAMAQSRRPKEAINLLDQFVAKEPNDLQAQFVLARSLLQDKKQARSEVAFSKVIEINPDLPQPYFFAGRINYITGDHNKAISRLSKYIALDGSGNFAPQAHFMAGSSMFRTVDQAADKAAQFASMKTHMSAFLAALPNTDPRAPEAHYVLGWLAAQEEDDATAKTHFETYIQIAQPGPQLEEAKQFIASLESESSSDQ